jgi:hypothetical protein
MKLLDNELKFKYKLLKLLISYIFLFQEFVLLSQFKVAWIKSVDRKEKVLPFCQIKEGNPPESN